MTEFELFGLLAVAVAVAALARRYGWPAPLVLVGVGLAASFMPFVPHYQVNPHLLLDLVLPPLLYSAALSSSYTDLRRSLNSITRLGVGLVLVSAAVVALVAVWLLPPPPFAAAPQHRGKPGYGLTARRRHRDRKFGGLALDRVTPMVIVIANFQQPVARPQRAVQR